MSDAAWDASKEIYRATGIQQGIWESETDYAIRAYGEVTGNKIGSFESPQTYLRDADLRRIGLS